MPAYQFACVPCIVGGLHTLANRCHKRGNRACFSCKSLEACVAIPAHFEAEAMAVLQMQQKYDDTSNPVVKSVYADKFMKVLKELQAELEVWFHDEIKRREEAEKREREERERREEEERKRAEEEKKKKEREDDFKEYQRLERFYFLRGQYEGLTNPPRLESLLGRLVQTQEAIAAALQKQVEIAAQTQQFWHNFYESKQEKRQRSPDFDDVKDGDEKRCRLYNGENSGSQSMDTDE
ncbi:hypothetical protein AAP_01349 [Ascosphaera apis ARSEF 7405]|uniref:Uncharacterized protein n=1 Tax=Ascosphaera apis ARSEF 7405 TaxID=392613 RepID=A0A162IMS9_9EURO|nr:hypothetical protein AAP_01349 [Ascosphaera apis ARSEF 7405]